MPVPRTRSPGRRALARRVLVALAYALCSIGLTRTVAEDLPWVRSSLYEVGSTLPAVLGALAPDPVGVALVAIGGFTLVLALGSFLVSRGTGGAFALLATATTGWFLFPYAEVPWATVLTGAEAQTPAAPTAAWGFAGAIIALATLEIAISAREQLLATLRSYGLPAGPGTAVHRLSRRSTTVLVGGSLALGGLLSGVYLAYRAELNPGLFPEPDLLWVPAVLGLVLAGILWWVGQRS